MSTKRNIPFCTWFEPYDKLSMQVSTILIMPAIIILHFTKILHVQFIPHEDVLVLVQMKLR